jgi:hypothetical protein
MLGGHRGSRQNWLICRRSALAGAAAPDGVISAIRSRVAGGREGRQARHWRSVFSSVSTQSYLPTLPVTNPIEYPPSVLVPA